MPVFELLERDGLARIGRLETPHGPIDTPALLPVVHPDPKRQSVKPRQLRAELGFQAVITSSYITWRTPPLRAVAERSGIHGLLGFDGVVMTDSGAFQQHAYGSVEVGPEEILAFQGAIGADIATVLDHFTEPETPPDAAAAALTTTMERARAARTSRSGLLAVPVQGGAFPELRARAAREASELADVLAVGGVVPLMEQYRFRELAEALRAARPELAPEIPVHLFGAGHPMVFALAALFGVDLFDSSAYHKFARRDRLLFPEGTVPLDAVREPICLCPLCTQHPLVEVAEWPAAEREAHLALHNLRVSAEEVARVRQAIRDGTLWELAERRAAAHPSLRAGLRAAQARPEVFLPTEPESRRAFRQTGNESAARPALERFRRRLSVFLAGRDPGPSVPRMPLRPDFLGRLPADDAAGRPIVWMCATAAGMVPLELTDLYPVGPYLGLEEFEGEALPRRPSLVADWVERVGVVPVPPTHDLSVAWTERQVAALLEWRYGRALAGALAPRLRGERSRRTGRLRGLTAQERPAFVVGDDGIPRPTFVGARLLYEALPPGRERLVVTEDAAPFALEGRSVFSKFVERADPALVPGMSALVVDPSDRLLGVGRLHLAPHEMGRLRRGIAAVLTSHAHSSEPKLEEDEPLEAWPPEAPE
jgi:7-cyano-7-deazaguanine tRNA-ribosyltransferase